jgi:hypothetical protein
MRVLFDGTQTPLPVLRLGDVAPNPSPVYSVPNFYGAHGHDSELLSMSAILYAAGPHIRKGKRVKRVHNIDIAPRVMELLGIAPAGTVDGRVIERFLNRRGD